MYPSCHVIKMAVYLGEFLPKVIHLELNYIKKEEEEEETDKTELKHIP